MNPEHLWMWWPCGGMWFFPIVIFVIIFFFLFSMRCRHRHPWWGPGGHHREGGDSETALEILKKRYAKGEITKEEFDQMKKDISSS